MKSVLNSFFAHFFILIVLNRCIRLKIYRIVVRAVKKRKTSNKLLLKFVILEFLLVNFKTNLKKEVYSHLKAQQASLYNL